MTATARPGRGLRFEPWKDQPVPQRSANGPGTVGASVVGVAMITGLDARPPHGRGGWGGGNRWTQGKTTISMNPAVTRSQGKSPALAGACPENFLVGGRVPSH